MEEVVVVDEQQLVHGSAQGVRPMSPSFGH